MTNRFSIRKLSGAIFSSAFIIITAIACSYATEPQPTESSPAVLSSPQAEGFQALVTADVVYLGERHDSEADHAAQLEIIESMYAESPDMAIALEMFQRPFQPVIDRYLAGDISEAELVAQSEYEQRWGFPWVYYAPILRFAQNNQIPVLALNAPSEVVRQVAREGLDSLEGDDFRYIPPLSEIDTSNTDYQDFVRVAFGSHGSHGSFNFEQFFAAQVLWDETMAMTIAEFKQANPATQVVVLAGQGHVVYGYGIPDRVARRWGDRLDQQIVLLNPDTDLELGAVRAIADIFWQSE